MEFSPPWLKNSQKMICAIAMIAWLLQVMVNAEVKSQALHVNASHNPQELEVKWSDFPSDFVFGVGTSAAQIEGSADKAGRGPSVWDEFVEKFPERADNHSGLSTAIDSYNRYKEDVKAIKALGVDSYRFSISWTRILPKGTLSGGINQEGVDHYNNLIDELIKNGIRPYATIVHFDIPQALVVKYGGYLNRSLVDDIKDYSELCFKTYGDRVKNWMTINEPFIIAKMGHDLGLAPPGRCSVPGGNFQYCTAGNSSTEPYIVAHNLLLAHATVVKLYREKFQANQAGEIGWSLVNSYPEPYSNSTEDKAAARRSLDFELGWFMEPLVYGDYPKSMRHLAKDRLPRFTKEEKKLVKGSFDFVTINYYTARYARSIPAHPDMPSIFRNDSLVSLEIKNVNGVPIGPQSEGSSYIYPYPQGLNKLLMFMKQEYRSPKIYITENGITEANDDKRGLDVALKDPHRIDCILRHLYMVKQAIKEGVNVKGYFYWSLFDDFEWSEGFMPRYGLYYVDYKDNLKRIPKQSAKWLPKFLKGEDTTCGGSAVQTWFDFTSVFLFLVVVQILFFFTVILYKHRDAFFKFVTVVSIIGRTTNGAKSV